MGEYLFHPAKLKFVYSFYLNRQESSNQFYINCESSHIYVLPPNPSGLKWYGNNFPHFSVYKRKEKNNQRKRQKKQQTAGKNNL